MQDPRKFNTRKLFAIVFGSFLLATAIILPLAVYNSSASNQDPLMKRATGDLPGCEIHPFMSCSGSSGDMDPKWKDNEWNTPPRNHTRWLPGFQDMSALQGYARLTYNADKTSCEVFVYTKTKSALTLVYFFDGVGQTPPRKTYTSSYKGVLKIVVQATTGERLVLDDVDFMWNAPAIKERAGDFRKGQKGAIVELFGWPDEDIAQECKHIAEAGYLGVKLFPHQEQLMSVQPFEYEMNPWYFMYQPVSYRLQGRMGSREQLRKTIHTCRSYGLRVYADAVVNHMTGGANDVSLHRNPGAGCTKWPPKNSSAGEDLSPFYTPSYTYEINDYNGRGNNALEFPGVPYGPMDFHCDKPCNAWTDPNNLNTGWLVGLADLDTSKDYVRQRIADFFVDLLSIGFAGFRIDAAKHIHPKDLAQIFAKFKAGMGGKIPDDWFTFLEVLTGGESWLLVRDSEYSFTTGLTREMQAVGLSNEDIDKVRIWWSGYPVEPHNDQGSLAHSRKVIQNDDHDQQNDGSSSRSLHDKGCVLVKGCTPAKHREFEMKLFTDPYEVRDNDNDWPIRMILSSYYFTNSKSPPDGKSDCSLCKVTCDGCKSRGFARAYQSGANAYEGTDYTRVHRDPQIIAAMRQWMHM